MPGKSRLFIGFTAILILFIFALFHSSQQQVDELRVAGLKCEQHEMALRSEFDAQVEKLSRLEKSLESSRNGMQGKLRAEKDLRDKAVADAHIRFTALQQHYKSLQKEHDATKTQFAQSKKAQLEQMNNYESRIQVLTSEVAQNKREKTASTNDWKVSRGPQLIINYRVIKLPPLSVQVHTTGDEIQKTGGSDEREIGRTFRFTKLQVPAVDGGAQ